MDQSGDYKEDKKDELVEVAELFLIFTEWLADSGSNNDEKADK